MPAKQVRRWHSTILREASRANNNALDYTISSSQSGSDSEAFSLANESELFSLTRRVLKLGGISESGLRRREIGAGLKKSLQDEVLRNLQPWRSWNGASKDVVSVAWGASNYFAVGSSADHLDGHGIPYNKSNNLLVGNIGSASDVLVELPDHHVPRSSVVGLFNAEIYDTRLFSTVSHVTFAAQQNILLSASYDKTVKLWSLPNSLEAHSRPWCAQSLQHDEYVEFVRPMLTRFATDPLVVATAQKSRLESIRLYGLSSDATNCAGESSPQPVTTFASSQAVKYNIFPSSLEWGPDINTRNYLLAGFAEISQNSLTDREGHLCLWDVMQPEETLIKLASSTENVFDTAWQPGKAIIAAATTPRNTLDMSNRHNTKSVVRTWSPTESRTVVYELECPALDVNEVQFHPTNGSIICASCTDGRTYVWDIRNPNDILMVLEHGSPIEEHHPDRPLEEQDVGVRFASWGPGGRYLYTGSSDGQLACWDVLCSSEQALVSKVAQFDAGIMAGAFSADNSKLLLGLVKGSVEILSVEACSKFEANRDSTTTASRHELVGTFEYVSADEAAKAGRDDHSSAGIVRGAELLSTEQLIVDAVFGPVQGPKYQGPWCLESRPKGTTEPANTPLLPNVAAMQFDPYIRDNGIARGGVAPYAERAWRDARNLASARKEALTNTCRTFESRPDSLYPSRKDLEQESFPDTIELVSLSELAKVGPDTEALLPTSVMRKASPSSTMPAASTDSQPATPKKRPNHDYETPGRKRSREPALGRTDSFPPRATGSISVSGSYSYSFSGTNFLPKIFDLNTGDTDNPAADSTPNCNPQAATGTNQTANLSTMRMSAVNDPQTPRKTSDRPLHGLSRQASPGRKGFIFPAGTPKKIIREARASKSPFGSQSPTKDRQVKGHNDTAIRDPEGMAAVNGNSSSHQSPRSVNGLSMPLRFSPSAQC